MRSTEVGERAGVRPNPGPLHLRLVAFLSLSELDPLCVCIFRCNFPSVLLKLLNIPSQVEETGVRPPGIETLLPLPLHRGVKGIGLELLRGCCVCVSVGRLY